MCYKFQYLLTNYYIRYDCLEEDIIKLCEILKITDYNINLLSKHKFTFRKTITVTEIIMIKRLVK